MTALAEGTADIMGGDVVTSPVGVAGINDRVVGGVVAIGVGVGVVTVAQPVTTPRRMRRLRSFTAQTSPDAARQPRRSLAAWSSSQAATISGSVISAELGDVG